MVFAVWHKSLEKNKWPNQSKNLKFGHNVFFKNDVEDVLFLTKEQNKM